MQNQAQETPAASGTALKVKLDKVEKNGKSIDA